MAERDGRWALMGRKNPDSSPPERREWTLRGSYQHWQGGVVNLVVAGPQIEQNVSVKVVEKAQAEQEQAEHDEAEARAEAEATEYLAKWRGTKAALERALAQAEAARREAATWEGSFKGLAAREKELLAERDTARQALEWIAELNDALELDHDAALRTIDQIRRQARAALHPENDAA